MDSRSLPVSNPFFLFFKNLCLCAFVAVFCLSLNFSLSGQSKTDYYDAGRIERELVELVNRARLEQGRRPLLTHPALGDIAYKHSLKMAREKKLSHRFPNYKTLPQRMMDAGVFFLQTGENVAFSEGIVAEYIHRGFMESTGHRRNILDPSFTHCGIRLARSGDDFYVTQVFAELYTPLPDEETEALLEDYIRSRFPGEFNNRVVFIEEIKPYARISSKLYSKSENTLDAFVKSLPDEWGKFVLVTMLSPRLEDIKKELDKEIGGKRFGGAAVGITRTRSEKFPGGAYSAAVLLVKGMAARWTEEAFRSALLVEINRVRNARGYSPVQLDTRFSNRLFPITSLSGTSWESEYRAQVNAIQRRADRAKVRVVSFTADDPSKIPSEFMDSMLESSAGKIGILVHTPVHNGIRSNYYMVTLIF